MSRADCSEDTAAFTVPACVWYRVIIRLEQRQIKQHQAILLICKSTSFGYQRLATLCTFCLSINTLMGLQQRMSFTGHPNGEGKIKPITICMLFKDTFFFHFFQMHKLLTMSEANLAFYFSHRSHFMRRRNSRAAAITAAATARTCTHISAAATPSGWRVVCGWSMRDPTTRVSSTSSALENTPTTSNGWLSVTASSPAAS